MSGSDDAEASEKAIQVSATELEALRRLKLVQEAKAELIAWGKQWAIIITITVTAVGLIGLNVIVATVIRGFVADDIKEAQKTAIVATEYLGRARAEMEKATKAATEYTDQVQQIKGRAETVDKSLKTLEASLEGKGRSTREEARLLTQDLQKRIEILEKTLTDQIAASSSENKVAKFRAETERLERDATKRQASFQSNAEYTVQIAFYERANSSATDIARSLEKLGFRTLIQPDAKTPEEDVGVPKGTFSAATKAVLVHDKGQEQKASLIANTIESVLDRGSVQVVVVPPSSNAKWIVAFLPRKK